MEANSNKYEDRPCFQPEEEPVDEKYTTADTEADYLSYEAANSYESPALLINQYKDQQSPPSEISPNPYESPALLINQCNDQQSPPWEISANHYESPALVINKYMNSQSPPSEIYQSI